MVPIGRLSDTVAVARSRYISVTQDTRSGEEFELQILGQEARTALLVLFLRQIFGDNALLTADLYLTRGQNKTAPLEILWALGHVFGDIL